MSWLQLVALAGAAGVGAALRFLVTAWFATRTRFPAGTLAVNLSGSFLLGFLVGAAGDHPGVQVLTTGLLGGYTTFSAASLDTYVLLKERKPWQALVSGFVQLLLALVAAGAGLVVGVALGAGH